MQTKNTFAVLVLICVMAFNASSQTITATTTNLVTFKGRVLDDATGKPIAGAALQIFDERFPIGVTMKNEMLDPVTHKLIPTMHSHQTRHYDDSTDAEGRYILPNTTGHIFIQAHATNHVGHWLIMDATNEESMVSVPDIRLQHGGWISGRVERPAGAGLDPCAGTGLDSQDYSYIELPIHNFVTGPDGTFRTGDLPTGSYTLFAIWNSTNAWHALGSVSNITLIAGQETTNVFIPMRMVVYTNSASGR